MKKKILTALVLCVGIFALSGCFGKGEEVTLENGFKIGLEEEYLDFQKEVISSSGNLVSEVDIVGNEVFIISKNEIFDIIETNEELKKEFIEGTNINEAADSVIESGSFEQIKEMVKGYEGETIFTYIFKTTNDVEILKFSFNKDGIIETE